MARIKIKVKRKKGWNLVKKKRKGKIIIVVYLAGYDSKVRIEEEVDASLSFAELREKRKKLKQKLIKDFGGFWSSYRKGKIKSGSNVVKVKAYRQRIVLKGRDFGFREINTQDRIVSLWTERQEQKALILRQQGLNYSRIAKNLGRTRESVRSKILRLQGKKK